MKGRLKTSPGIIIPLVTMALKHPSSSTLPHAYKIQISSANCSRACLPTLQLPYASSDARSIKRFCSRRYCWRSQSFWPSFSIFWRERSLLCNTLPLAACCCFCCLSCSRDSCSSISCRDCALLLRKSYIKIKMFTIVQPDFMLNFIRNYHWQKSEMGIIYGNSFLACRKTASVTEMENFTSHLSSLYTCQKNVTLHLFTSKCYNWI